MRSIAAPSVAVSARRRPSSRRRRDRRPRLGPVKIAHVRERHAPAGTPVAARRGARCRPAGWTSRRRAAARRAQDRPRPQRGLFRQPITTLDAHLARGLRVDALADLLDAERRRADGCARTSTSGRRSSQPPTLPRLLRLRAARRHDVEAARHGDPGGVVPAADLLLQQRLGDPRARRPGLGAAGSRSSTTSSRSPRSSTRRCATSTRRAARRRSAATRSSTTGAPATSSARRRRSGSARPRARTSPPSIGPWLVTPDELADARRARATIWR